MPSTRFRDMDQLHQEKAMFVAFKLDPLLAEARSGWGASYETDGADEYVCLQMGGRARSVCVTGDNLFGILVDVAKVLAKM